MINTGLHKIEVKKIQDVFAVHAEVEKVLLYGSRAKGNYKPAFDIDLALIGEMLNLTILQKIENEIDDLLLPYKCDLTIYQQISNKDLIDHIKRVGKIFNTNKRTNGVISFPSESQQ